MLIICLAFWNSELRYAYKKTCIGDLSMEYHRVKKLIEICKMHIVLVSDALLLRHRSLVI